MGVGGEMMQGNFPSCHFRVIQLLLADTVLSVDWVVSRCLNCLDAGKQKEPSQEK